MARIYRVIPEHIYERFVQNFNENEEESKDKPLNPNFEFFISFFPKNMQNRATRILHALKDHINLNGEFIFDSKPISNSHIVDLILFSLKTLPNQRSNVVGLSEFIKTINSKNIPKDLFSKTFVQFISEFRPAANSNWKTFESSFESL